MSPPSQQFLKHAIRATMAGATITALSTVFSCSLAIGIEGVAHRTLYKFFPHWYDDVKYAYGLDLHLKHPEKRRIVAADGGGRPMPELRPISLPGQQQIQALSPTMDVWANC